MRVVGRWTSLRYGLVAVLALSLAIIGGIQTVSAIPLCSGTFSYSGAEQSCVVPPGASTLRITAIGAPGQSRGAVTGGKGATVVADVAVSPSGPITPGETLYVEVGGAGASAGGFNGGGHAGSGFGTAGGGGGASDVQTCARATCAPGSGAAQAGALLVAGGGGGAGNSNGSNAGGAGGPAGANADGSGTSGGNGGSGSGGVGGTGGHGGSTGAGGAGGTGFRAGDAGSSGSAGQGGAGGSGTIPGGGGGGGYFGGGGAGAGDSPGGLIGGGGGGGGGTSFIVASGATNVSFATDTTGAPSITFAELATATPTPTATATATATGTPTPTATASPTPTATATGAPTATPSPQPPPPEPDRGWVVGNVVDSNTLAPVPGAVVALEDAPTVPRQGPLGFDGFLFPGLAIDRGYGGTSMYKVRLASPPPGYHVDGPDEQEASVSSDQGAPVTFKVRRDPYWTQVFAAGGATLWSGEDDHAVALDHVPQWSLLRVEWADGNRACVYNPRTRNWAYADPASLGPADPPPGY